MTTVRRLQRELQAAGVELSLVDNRLRYSAPGALPPSLLVRLKERKEVLCQLLRTAPGPLLTFPTSAPQRQLWALSNLHPDRRGHLAYVEAVFYVVQAHLDLTLLQCATDLLVARHSTLRTEIEASGTQQTVLPPTSAPLLELGRASSIGELLDRARVQLCTPRSLDAAPTPFVVVGTTNTESLVGVMLHHASCDGVGLCLLLHELGVCYAGLAQNGVVELPPSPMFATYVDARAALRASSHGQRSLQHWSDLLESSPHRAPRGDSTERSYRARRHVSRLAVRWSRFERIAKSWRVTPFALALAAFGRGIDEVESSEVVSGLVSLDARDVTDCRGVIGYCSEVYPVVFSPRADWPMLVKATCKTLFDVISNHASSLADLTEKRSSFEFSPQFTATFLDLHELTHFGDLPATIVLPETPYRDARLTLNLHRLPEDRIQLCCDYTSDWIDEAHALAIVSRIEAQLISLLRRAD